MAKKNNNAEPYPVPKNCPYCSYDVVLTTNAEIYGKQYGDGKCYLCRHCGASVGTHLDTDIPLGRMADEQLKALKKQAHALFDPIWKSRKKYRWQCYQQLSIEMDIPQNKCHFGWFDTYQLQEAISILRRGLFLREEKKPGLPLYIDYSGKSIMCITKKFGNFTYDKVYPIIAKGRYLNGNPANFVITDDEGDDMNISLCIKSSSKFKLID